MAAVGVCRRGMHRMSRPLRRGRRGIRDRLPEAAPPLSSPPFARAAARQTSRFAPCVRGLRRLRSAPLEPPDAASSALSFREAGAWVPRGGPRTGKGRAPQGGPYGSFRPASVPVRTSWAGDGPYGPRPDRKRSAETLLGRATGRTPPVRRSRRGEERGPRGERRIGRRETLRVCALRSGGLAPYLRLLLSPVLPSPASRTGTAALPRAFGRLTAARVAHPETA